MPLGTGTIGGPNVYNATIGTTATLAVVGANPSRVGLTIQNNSANVITFTFGTVTPVSQSIGVQIPANSNFTLPPSGMGTVGNIGAQLNMIASGASSAVSVLEYF